MRTRTGEASRSWFRSERYYHTGDGWWFSTREDSELGPFHSQNEAESEFVMYIRKINTADNFPTASL